MPHIAFESHMCSFSCKSCCFLIQAFYQRMDEKSGGDRDEIRQSKSSQFQVVRFDSQGVETETNG